MIDLDLILIAQSEIVDYDGYSQLPLDRLPVYREYVFPRMVRYREAFHSHLDLLNVLRFGRSFANASFEERRSFLSVWNLPSLSGMHLANYLLQQGLRVRIINNLDSEWDWFCKAYSSSPSKPLVGISSTFHLNYTPARAIARKLRGFDPEMQILLGGAFANAQTLSQSPSAFETPMRRYGIDYILHGFHAEPDVRDLLQARRGLGNISAVANLAHITPAGDFRCTSSRWNPPLLDDQPDRWDELYLPFVNRTVQLRTACGCPFSCAFCSYPTVAHGHQTMPTESLARSLAAIRRIPGVSQLVFIDDTFNLPRERFRAICRLLLDAGLGWYSFLRVQYVDDDDVKLMRDSGCQAVYLGVESANDQVLSNMNKRTTHKQFRRGVELLRKHGIVSVGAFVLGFPGETDQTIADNLDFIETSGLNYFTLKPFYYMAHTAVHQKRATYGLTGMGAQWAHATMDSNRAQEQLFRLFQDCRNACYLDSDTSLWYLILLRDAGYSFNQIDGMQREINGIVRSQMCGEFDDNHPGLARLTEVLKGSSKNGAR